MANVIIEQGLSFIEYDADGSSSSFMFAFPYLKGEDVHCYINGNEVAYSFLNESEVSLTVPPITGDRVTVRRLTKRDERLVDYQDSGQLREKTLDLDSNQLFYVTQEALDLAAFALIVDITDNSVDLDDARIKNLGDPIDPTDAVPYYLIGDSVAAAQQSAQDAEDAKVAAEAALSVAEDIQGDVEGIEGNIESIQTNVTNIQTQVNEALDNALDLQAVLNMEEQTVEPTSPDTGYSKVFVKEDGLYIKKDGFNSVRVGLDKIDVGLVDGKIVYPKLISSLTSRNVELTGTTSSCRFFANPVKEVLVGLERVGTTDNLYTYIEFKGSMKRSSWAGISATSSFSFIDGKWSPDGKYFAVVRKTTALDYTLTLYELEDDNETLTSIYSYGPVVIGADARKIYWSPDSLSFYFTPPKGDGTFDFFFLNNNNTWDRTPHTLNLASLGFESPAGANVPYSIYLTENNNELIFIGRIIDTADTFGKRAVIRYIRGVFGLTYLDTPALDPTNTTEVLDVSVNNTENRYVIKVTDGVNTSFEIMTREVITFSTPTAITFSGIVGDPELGVLFSPDGKYLFCLNEFNLAIVIVPESLTEYTWDQLYTFMYNTNTGLDILHSQSINSKFSKIFYSSSSVGNRQLSMFLRDIPTNNTNLFNKVLNITYIRPNLGPFKPVSN